MGGSTEVPKSARKRKPFQDLKTAKPKANTLNHRSPTETITSISHLKKVATKRRRRGPSSKARTKSTVNIGDDIFDLSILAGVDGSGKTPKISNLSTMNSSVTQKHSREKKELPKSKNLETKLNDAAITPKTSKSGQPVAIEYNTSMTPKTTSTTTPYPREEYDIAFSHSTSDSCQRQGDDAVTTSRLKSRAGAPGRQNVALTYLHQYRQATTTPRTPIPKISFGRNDDEKKQSPVAVTRLSSLDPMGTPSKTRDSLDVQSSPLNGFLLQAPTSRSSHIAAVQAEGEDLGRVGHGSRLPNARSILHTPHRQHRKPKLEQYNRLSDVLVAMSKSPRHPPRTPSLSRTRQTHTERSASAASTNTSEETRRAASELYSNKDVSGPFKSKLTTSVPSSGLIPASDDKPDLMASGILAEKTTTQKFREQHAKQRRWIRSKQDASFEPVSKQMLERARLGDVDNPSVMEAMLSSRPGDLGGTMIELKRSDSLDPSVLTCDTAVRTLGETTGEGESLTKSNETSKASVQLQNGTKISSALPVETAERPDHPREQLEKNGNVSEDESNVRANSELAETDARNRMADTSTVVFQVPRNDEREAACVDGTNQAIFLSIGERTIPHPKLPPGWKIRISKTKKRPFYCHPEFGTTWLCPVVLPSPEKTVDEQDSPSSSEGGGCGDDHDGNNPVGEQDSTAGAKSSTGFCENDQDGKNDDESKEVGSHDESTVTEYTVSHAFSKPESTASVRVSTSPKEVLDEVEATVVESGSDMDLSDGSECKSETVAEVDVEVMERGSDVDQSDGSNAHFDGQVVHEDEDVNASTNHSQLESTRTDVVAHEDSMEDAQVDCGSSLSSRRSRKSLSNLSKRTGLSSVFDDIESLRSPDMPTKPSPASRTSVSPPSGRNHDSAAVSRKDEQIPHEFSRRADGIVDEASEEEVGTSLQSARHQVAVPALMTSEKKSKENEMTQITQEESDKVSIGSHLNSSPRPKSDMSASKSFGSKSCVSETACGSTQSDASASFGQAIDCSQISQDVSDIESISDLTPYRAGVSMEGDNRDEHVINPPLAGSHHSTSTSGLPKRQDGGSSTEVTSLPASKKGLKQLSSQKGSISISMVVADQSRHAFISPLDGQKTLSSSISSIQVEDLKPSALIVNSNLKKKKALYRHGFYMSPSHFHHRLLYPKLPICSLQRLDELFDEVEERSRHPRTKQKCSTQAKRQSKAKCSKSKSAKRRLGTRLKAKRVNRLIDF